jgi:hypothetical protein
MATMARQAAVSLALYLDGFGEALSIFDFLINLILLYSMKPSVVKNLSGSWYLLGLVKIVDSIHAPGTTAPRYQISILSFSLNSIRSSGLGISIFHLNLERGIHSSHLGAHPGYLILNKPSSVFFSMISALHHEGPI